MDESQQKSVLHTEQIHHLKAEEQVSLTFSDAEVNVLANADGGCTVKVTYKEEDKSLKYKAQKWNEKLQALKTNAKFQKSLPVILLICCLAIYLSTRLIGLRQYPVYFFTDEAVQTLLAEDLVNKNFIGNDGVFLPTFFYNGYQYNLGTSVYLQVIPYMLFGRVMEVNRGVSVLASSLAAIFLFLLARRSFKLKFPWAIVLLLSITPVWFLHSRTAFETSLAFMFYSGFVYYYFAYRNGERNKIFFAVLMAALTFYTYSPVRVVVVLNALVFFIIDFRYHFEKPQKIGLAFAFMLVTTLPLIRFQFEHPSATLEHLSILGSYWIQDISIFAKIGIYLQEYISSFSPTYWFWPDMEILSRHRMGRYALIPTWFFPFIVTGLIVAITKWKEPAYRDMILILIMAPVGGSVVARGVTRILIMLIPFLCMALIGLNFIIRWINRRLKFLNIYSGIILFVFLVAGNIFLFADALNNGAKWDTDYGMTGLQYGTIELVEKIPQYLQDMNDPSQLMLTPTWANGTDSIMRFFFGTPLPFRIGNIDTYITTYNPMPEDLTMIMTVPEYNHMLETHKFTNIDIVDTIYYPDGHPGFYFVKLDYVENIEEIFEAEAAERKILQVGVVEVSGVPATVAYSYMDMGQVSDLFDHDIASITRTFEANPMIVQVDYDYPVDLQSCTAHIGGIPSNVSLSLYDEENQLISEYQIDTEEKLAPHTIDFEIEPAYDVSQVWLSLANAGEGEPAHVHLWEFTCTPLGE